MSKARLIGIVGISAASTLSYFVPDMEGMILRGYKDPVGIVTACAGHTATAQLGKPYTRAECQILLEQDLAIHAEGVMKCIKVPVTAGQKAAFVSFAYNVGVGAFCNSTMLKRVNAGEGIAACSELSRWTTAKGKVYIGLVKRRAAERVICESDL
jgi:lysozyme